MIEEILFHMLAKAPTPVAPFSHAVETDGWVFVTGQMPTLPNDPVAPLAEGIEAQTRQVMHNLNIVLNEIGLGFEHVIRAGAYLTDFKRDYAAFNRVYSSYFVSGKLPARTCIGVTALAVDALVEIDFIARRS